MKSEKLIELIRHPEMVSNEDLRELDDLVCRYPFFQTARILYLKALYLKAGPRFRNELKLSTVHITDHKQLFRYLNQQLLFDTGGGTPVNAALDEIVDERIREIDGHIEVTSPGIPAYPQTPGNRKAEEDETVSLNFSVPTSPEPIQHKPFKRRQPEDSPVISNPIQLDDIPGVINDYNEPAPVAPKRTTGTTAAPAITLPDLSGIPGMISEEKTESVIGSTAMPPMDLDLEDVPANEPAPVPETRNTDTPLETPEILSSAYRLPEEQTATAQPAPEKNKRKKKNQLIDQFIQTAPVMPKITATTDTRDLSKENPFSPDELFSETLAKIYVKQGLYERAIQTYIKLSLKYPEKSVYFADRIENIKQNINNQE